MSRTCWLLLAACALAPLRPALALGLDSVRVGSGVLRGARLAAGHDTVDAWRIADGVRTPTSTTIRSVTLRTDGPEPRFEIRTLHWAPQGDTSVTRVTLRARDLALVQHSVRAAHDSAAVTVADTHLSGWVVLPNRPVRLLDHTLAHPVFPVEGQIPWLMPLLPLAPGYRATVAHYSPWEGREVWSTIEVTGAERVEVHGRGFDCWRVDAGPLGPPGYRMTRWVDRGSRRVVLSVLRGAEGLPEFWGHRRP